MAQDNIQDQSSGQFDPMEFLQNYKVPEPPKETDRLGDIGRSLKSGVEQLPGMVTGLLDIPSALAFNERPFSKAADAIGEATGFQPGKWANEIKYSDEYKNSQADIEKAWQDSDEYLKQHGFGADYLKDLISQSPKLAAAYFKNPLYTLNQVTQSLPSMLAGGAIGRGVNVAGRVAGRAAVAADEAAGIAGKEAVAAAPGYLERGFSKMGASAENAGNLASEVAGGIGEGAVQAGQAMDQYKGDDARKGAISALGSGAADALIAFGAGRAAHKMGLETAGTAMAKAGDDAHEVSRLGFLKRLAAGGINEGALQEFPQSMQEQMWQNYAEGKPIMEGVVRKGVEGGMAGFAMGAGANVMNGHPHPTAQAAQQPDSPLSRAAVAGNPDLSAAPAAESDPFTVRANEVEQQVRDGNLLDRLRQVAGNPDPNYNISGEFLQALATAKNPNAPANLRQQAVDSLDQAMSWIEFGKSPHEAATGSPFGSALAPIEPAVAQQAPGAQPKALQDPNIVDVEATRTDNMLPGPRALPAPTTAIPNQTGETNGPQATQAQQAEAQGQAQPAATAAVNQGQSAPGADSNSGAQNKAPYGTNIKEDATQIVARTQADRPQVVIPNGPGTAQMRKAKAEIGSMVQDGFDDVEQRNGEFWLVNHRTNQETKLTGAGEAALARKAVSDKINAQAHESPNSTRNDKSPASQAQIEAKNYHKPPLDLHGTKYRIENPAGSSRSGTSPDGKKWSTKMNHHYGEVEGTRGADGDKVDAFINPNPVGSKVFVVDQLNKDGTFDEHKAMIGFRNSEEARAAYLSNYEKGWTGLGAITEMSTPEFRKWAKSPEAKLPLDPKLRESYHPKSKEVSNGNDTGPNGAGSEGAAVAEDSTGDGRGGESIHGIGEPRQRAGIGDQSGDAGPGTEGQNLRDRAADKAAAEALGKQPRVAREIPLADDGSPDGAALNALLDAFARLTGYRGIAVNDTAPKAADGYEHNGRFFVNVSNPEMHVAHTIGHEFKHLSDRYHGLSRLYDSIFSLIGEDGKQRYADYLSANGTIKKGPVSKLDERDIERLKDEMVSDFMGRRMTDRAWLEQLGKQKPALFAEFVKSWLKLLGDLKSALAHMTGLGSERGAKNIDLYIKQLDEAKAIAMEVAEEWAKQKPSFAEKANLDQALAQSRMSDRLDEFTDLGVLGDELSDYLDQIEGKGKYHPNNITANVSDVEIASKGIMAESAFPKLQWKKVNDYSESAAVPNHHFGGEYHLNIEKYDGGWGTDSSGMKGTWVGPVDFETTGYASKDGVKAFINRQIAGEGLRERGFDIASTHTSEQLDNLVKAWDALNQSDNVRKFNRVGRAPTDFKEIARDMGVTKDYDLQIGRAVMDKDTSAVMFDFTNKATGVSQEATIDISRGERTMVAHTSTLKRSGLGAAFYQMAGEYASRNNLKLVPDHMLSGVNTYRRTEQMLSNAMRTGKSNAMLPHDTQRVYGFNDKAFKKSEHDLNVARLLLASLRNVREIAPRIDDLVYHPDSGVFKTTSGADGEGIVREILADVDSRAFGLGRSTLARAAITKEILGGKFDADSYVAFKEPVLYSARENAERERAAVIDTYRDTDGWLMAPNGTPTRLTDDQWVTVRTPSFKAWFGDWEKAHKDGGVWAHDDVSKVVGENGEPLVVYHGSDKAGFYEFNEPSGKQRGDLGIFTSSNDSLARSYVHKGRLQDLAPPKTKEDLERIGYAFTQDEGKVIAEDPDGYQVDSQADDGLFDTEDQAVAHVLKDFKGEANRPGVYALFLNIRNPNESNFEGANWSGERSEQYVVEDADGELISNENGRQYFNDHDEAMTLAEETGGTVSPAPEHYETTDSVVREARQFGNDGAIIREVVDDGGGPGYYGEPSDVFVAFKPNQIKSADWNTGEFGASDDIRYSDRDVPRGFIDVGGFNAKIAKDGSMLVIGDLGEIRAIIPEDVKGRAVKGGLQFTHSDAPRVRHALEGNNTAYSRAGNVNEKLALDSNGKYLGAPEKFNTPAKIPHLRKWLMKLTKEGEAGRFWYENSSKAVMRMVGGDLHEARKFVALLAIYSPQAKVDTNGTFALRAWAQHKAGEPINVKTRVMDEKAQRAMDNVEEFWSGEKTGNFFTNLLSEIDPVTRGKQGATIDMWMMRAAQYASDAPTKTQYAFMENETNRIARELGWEPQQVQAAIWVAMKARMENDQVKKDTEKKSEKKGWIHYEYPLKNGKPNKTRIVDKAQEHRDNWLAHAIAHDPSNTDTQRAKFDFEDSLRRHIGQVSWEARPGRSTGVLPGVNDAPYAQQVEFQQAVQKALYSPEGADLLAQKLGLLVDGDDVLAPGVWQGEIAAGMQKQIAMAPAKVDDGKTALDAPQKQALDVYSAVLGLLLRQEGVGWHRPFYSGKASQENGVELRVGRPLTPGEAKELWTAIDKRMREKGVADWEQNAGMISSPLGMRIVNFGALEENKAFRDLIKDSVGDLSFDVHGHPFTSDGNLVMNNWKENPNGQDFVVAIRDAGRSDLLGWSRDVLAPRVQDVFDEFSKKYDWGDPGQIRFSSREDIDGQRAVHGENGPGARPFSVGITGIHFSQQARKNLLGAYNGTGLKGAESARLAESKDPRIKSRVYFYVDEGSGITPEAGVGGIAHSANIDNLYNTKGDPLKLFKANDLNGSESRVLDAGYDGYYFPSHSNSQGIAVVLGHAADSIPVELSGYEKGRAPEITQPTYKWALMSREISKIDMGALQAVAPSAKLRSGNLTMDSSDFQAARSELADQGIDIPEMRYSSRIPGFYSELAKQIEKSTMNQAPAGAWKSFVKALTQKGVKPDEIEWTGVNDWLDLQDGKVQKADLMKFLEGNGVQVHEVTLGVKADLDKLNSKIEHIGYTAYEDSVEHTTYFMDEDGDVLYHDDLPDSIKKIVDKYAPEASAGPSKFGQYVVPGGENYREVLLTLPDGRKPAPEQMERPKVVDRGHDENGRAQFDVVVDGKVIDTFNTWSAAMNHAYGVQQDENIKRNLQWQKEQPQVYKSNHWEQPNVLAHLRVDDRTDADGNKVLFVQEIQSDWGQEGKKRGFDKPYTKQVKPDEYNDFIETLKEKASERLMEGAGLDKETASNVAGGLAHDTLADMVGMRSEFDDLMHRQEEDRTAEHKGSIPTAPFVTTTDGWLNLALKRVIKMAVDGGYDKVAFANGEQNAAHYDLSKEMDTLLYDDGNGNVIGRKDGGNVIVKTVSHSSEIADLVGKDIAERLLAAPKNGYGMRELKGLELKMGGEGMRTFYDKIVPIAAGKLSQKLGGGKVEMASLVVPDAGVRRKYMAGFDISTKKWGVKDTTSGEFVKMAQNSEDAQLMAAEMSSTQGRLEQPGITITDKMRDQVHEGIPLFSAREQHQSIEEFDASESAMRRLIACL